MILTPWYPVFKDEVYRDSSDDITDYLGYGQSLLEYDHFTNAAGMGFLFK